MTQGSRRQVLVPERLTHFAVLDSSEGQLETSGRAGSAGARMFSDTGWQPCGWEGLGLLWGIQEPVVLSTLTFMREKCRREHRPNCLCTVTGLNAVSGRDLMWREDL